MLPSRPAACIQRSITVKGAIVVVLACLLWTVQHGYPQEQPVWLPRPGTYVAEPPPLVPTVITAGGQRRLLNDTDVEVRYDAQRKRLFVNRPGWWIINYPFTRIKGFESKSADDIAQQLFGKTARQVRNWYIKTPGEPGPEPPAVTGPAPIELTLPPALIVNTEYPKAADDNPGTLGAPLKTIAAALERAKAGTVIHVYPGTYRESLKIEQSGTVTQPIRLEGVRDQTGRMPVISGNDPFPANSWKPVTGLVGVYRADLFSKQPGTLSLNGRTLIERSSPAELKPGEFCLNHASKEFLILRLDGTVNPLEGDRKDDKLWRRLRTDTDGFLDLSKAYREQARQAVFWASTFLWVEPRPKKAARDPDFPEPITGRLAVEGGFRAGRITGAPLSGQANTYRVWVNGQLLPSVIYSTEQDFQLRLPHPSRISGDAERWDNFPLQEGWNHLVFQLDTTSRPEKTRFRFTLPKGINAVVTSATNPPAQDKPTETPPLPYVSEYLVLGPFPAPQDLGVYVRLPGNADPNTVTMDLAARTNALVSVHGNFVQVRRFEIRHGAQWQQRAQVDLRGEGLLLEGNLIRDSEVGGIRFATAKDRTAAPIVIRNNWVVNPGHLGIGGGGSSDRLTPENQNGHTPGRSPVLIEHNNVINSNWAGFSPGWEAGGMKVFKLTGAVIRYNTIVGGSGPGIWLDWEHYGNRVEGNLLRSVYGYGIGVEASPGPNVIANNLLIHVRPGWQWFRAAILAWDSDRTWAVNNTIDGGWNPTVWDRTVGTIGINLGSGGKRRTRWGPLLDAQQVYVNNLVVGSQTALRPRKRDITEANFTDEGVGAESAEVVFRNPGLEDYRLPPQNPLRKRGVDNQVTQLVAYDFYGLPRFPDDGRTVGAFRRELVSKPNSGALIEVEFQHGELRRLYEIVP
jgi:parallel beta helix pectate lyase-like protein/uncharacterized protein DUF1565